jgi:hypothetical protein
MVVGLQMMKMTITNPGGFHIPQIGEPIAEIFQALLVM